jgi:hypothetical protein
MEAVPVVKVRDLVNGFPASLSILHQVFISTAHPDSNFAKNTPQGKNIDSFRHSQASLAKCGIGSIAFWGT